MAADEHYGGCDNGKNAERDEDWKQFRTRARRRRGLVRHGRKIHKSVWKSRSNFARGCRTKRVEFAKYWTNRLLVRFFRLLRGWRRMLRTPAGNRNFFCRGS